MEKSFDPAALESDIAAQWEVAGAFRAGRPERAGAAPFSIVIPPPNVTGNLHMGHALNNTLQDILARYWRMNGRDVLWQPGTDHAGIATQMVVERQLAERGEPGRREMGRANFLEKVWRWKHESGGAIIGQLKRLGASCDWSRERFTLGQNGAADDQMVKAVTKAFVELANTDGPNGRKLIYKDKRLVNWDPKFQTAISDLEVLQVEQRGAFKWTNGEVPLDISALNKALDRNPHGHLFYFKYPLEGHEGFITVGTTRPETMLGDTGIAVHPENQALKHLIGRNAILPLVGRLLPIVGDEYADPEKGTGAVKITPAHDFNDFEVGKRHNLKSINIFDAEAQLTLRGNHAFLAGLSGSIDANELLSLDGLDRFVARRRIVEMMARCGLLEKIEPQAFTVPHGDRSGVAIEPWLTDQGYVDAKTLAQPALAAVREGKTSFAPKNWEKTYFEWLENIQPWCVSRQLWWGHQIPAWYGRRVVQIDRSREARAAGTIWPGEDNMESGWNLDPPEVFVAYSEAEAIEQARAKYGCEIRVKNTPRGELDPIFQQAIDDENAGKPRWEPIWRDPDVLDTWFSSALWPFSTLGWPEQTPELKRFYPTNVLVTGFDIIFFWVARMMMMGLHFQKEVPFRDVYIHALVRDEKGAKMSKSKGNVIDPLDLVDRYGADALRFTMAAMAAQGRDIKMSESRVEGYRGFANKLWNASRFAEMNGCARTAGFDPNAVRHPLNIWVLGEARKAVALTGSAIEAYRFNDAANFAYRFVWNQFCDWHLELAKPLLQGEVADPARAETQATIAYVLDAIYALLHPFMPFVTEALWAIKGALGPPRASLLALAPWPQIPGAIDEQSAGEIDWVIALITEIRSVRSELGVPPSSLLPLTLVQASPAIAERATRWQETIKRLARVEGVGFGSSAAPGDLQIVVPGAIAAMPMAGVIDIDAEKSRLAKEVAREQGEIAKVEAKFANADFMARAPDAIVEENRERRAEAQARIAKLHGALAKLQAL